MVSTGCLRVVGRALAQRACYSSSSAVCPVQRESLKEMCILVDERDRAVGTASKRECHRVGPGGRLPLHRAFSVFLFNGKRELLLQKRSEGKITFPGRYTNACCSHPLYEVEAEREEAGALGVKRAACRRLSHELGVATGSVAPDDLLYLTRIVYKSTGDGVWGEHEIDYILFLVKDLDLDPNPEEVSEIRYVGRRDLDRFLAAARAPITPWFDLVVSHRLYRWWDNLDDLQPYQDHRTIHTFKTD